MKKYSLIRRGYESGSILLGALMVSVLVGMLAYVVHSMHVTSLRVSRHRVRNAQIADLRETLINGTSCIATWDVLSSTTCDPPIPIAIKTYKRGGQKILIPKAANETDWIEMAELDIRPFCETVGGQRRIDVWYKDKDPNGADLGSKRLFDPTAVAAGAIEPLPCN